MKVLIVDDHALIRDALGRVLTSIDSTLAITEAADPRTAFTLIDSEPDFDLVVLDLALPGMDGLTALQTLRTTHPALSVIVVSATADRESVQRALDHGALGFIPKSSSNDVMKNALRLILAGGIYVPPQILGRGDPALQSIESPAIGRAKTPADIGLTARQGEILALMMKGKSNKLICRELDLAESTVKNQVTAILKALNVTSRTQAVLEVGKLGLELRSSRSSRK